MAAALTCTRLLTALVTVACVLVTAQACTCAQEHPQTKFCNADFVLKARIRGGTMRENITFANSMSVPGVLQVQEKKVPIKWEYSIKVKKLYKESADLGFVGKRTRKYLSSSSMESACGVHTLQNDTRYVISGRVQEGALWFSLCDVHSDWNALSKQQKRGYAYKYKKHCQCKIETCYTTGCEDRDRDRDTCVWNPRDDPDQCHEKHCMCVRSKKGGCRWARPDDFHQCKNQSERRTHDEP